MRIFGVRRAIETIFAFLVLTASGAAAGEERSDDRRYQLAEVNLETGEETWRSDERVGAPGSEDVGASLPTMPSVDLVAAGVYVISSLATQRRCARGERLQCPEPGASFFFMPKEDTATERIAQGLEALGDNHVSSKTYSLLQYNKTLYVYETTTSRVLWERTWNPGESLLLASDNERIYAVTNEGVSAIDIRSSKEIWNQPAATGTEPTRVGQHDGKLLVQRGHRLFALNLATGALRWQYQAGASGDPWPQRVGEKHYVVTRPAPRTRQVCSGPLGVSE